jgi:predicted dienelactone hydrolase
VRILAPVGKPTGRRWAQQLIAGLAIGLGILGLTISIALPLLIPVFQFPHPTGPYAIGTLTYHWVDADRTEVFSANPNDHRELMVQIWYPAKGDSTSRRAPYVQDANALAPALARLFHFPNFTFAYWKYITTHAIPSAPVATGEPSYPVLIFLEGFNGFRQMNTYQVEELVSHGYIVAAIDQPYAAAAVVFPDGRQVVGWDRAHLAPLVTQSISPVEHAPMLNGRALKDGIVPYLAQDVIFTLNRLDALDQADPNGILTGRLDLQRSGIFGVSLGGIVGAEACRLDPRLRGFVVEDSPMPADVVQDGLRQPTMWISRDAKTMQLEGWSQTDPGAGIDISQSTMREVFASLPGDGYLVLVPGMFHLNLTDLPYLSPLTSWLGMTGPIDAQRAHNIINAYSLAFFDRYLKGQPEELLDGPAEQYPDVLFERRQP